MTRSTSTAALVLAALGSLSGCIDPAASAEQRELLAAEAARPPEHVAFVFDRSQSIQGHQLMQARDLMRDRIRSLGHGDRITALELLQRSIEEVPKRWSQTVPERERADLVLPGDSVARDRFLRDAVDYLSAFADTTGRDRITGTDILSTLHDVAEEFRVRPDSRKTLYLFSDMLQSTAEIEMEGQRRMPAGDWVTTAVEKGILPDLSGVCVVVVGGRVDNDAGQRVKEFWKRYFQATGATLRDENYSYRPVRLPGAETCA
ncbi:MAG: hypothetical protein R3E10_08735 [Gemmatimonadota bacterium]